MNTPNTLAALRLTRDDVVRIAQRFAPPGIEPIPIPSSLPMLNGKAVRSKAAEKILELLEVRPMTRKELFSVLDISKSLTSNIVDELKAKGLVRLFGTVTDARGNKVEVWVKS